MVQYLNTYIDGVFVRPTTLELTDNSCKLTVIEINVSNSIGINLQKQTPDTQLSSSAAHSLFHSGLTLVSQILSTLDSLSLLELIPRTVTWTASSFGFFFHYDSALVR